MKDILAKMFYNLAKLPLIQNYYIRKYNMSCVTEDGWNIIYSGDQWILASGVNTESWKHYAGMLGLSNNKIVIKILA